MVHRREAFIARRNYLGHTQESLAHKLCVSLATVSCWERGYRNPSSRHRQPLAELLQISMPELDQLLDPETPSGVETHAVPTWLSHYESVIQGSGRVDLVELVTVPAMLQTQAYASTLERLGPIVLTDDQVARRVEGRIARQGALHRQADPLHLSVLLSEVVLLQKVGSSGLMTEQLRHLVRAGEQPNIEVRLIPADGRAAVALASFEMLTRPGGTVPFMAVAVSVGGINYVEMPELLGVYVKMLRHLTSVALSPAETARRIRQLEENYQ
jgi:transcriptional regulator with XRE-family HTH domain